MPREPKPWVWKIGLFIVLWHEMAAQFRFGADAAFLASALTVWGVWYAHQFARDIAPMSDPLLAALIARGVLWLVLWIWQAPPILSAQPISFLVIAFVLLAFIGGRCRRMFDWERVEVVKPVLRENSEIVAGTAMGLVTIAALAHTWWGSVLPLAGYGALIGLPVSVGWMAAGPATETRFDARFGSEDAFRDAGVSDDFE